MNSEPSSRLKFLEKGFMNKLELDKKRDEQALKHSKHPIQDNHAAVIYAWNACADILLPEIERLQSSADSRVDDIVRQHDILTDVIANKRNEITQLEKELEQLGKDKASNDNDYLNLSAKYNTLEKENAELKTALGVAGEFIKRNDTLTAQLAIATTALEFAENEIHSEFCGNEHHDNCITITQALAKMKDVK